MEDVVILGSGIAGSTAAMYLARADIIPLVLTGMQDGGQLTMTTEVENYPGIEMITGPELAMKAKQQAEHFGAKFKIDAATAFRELSEGFELDLMGGETIQAKCVIIATGASARWLGIPSEEKFKGKGVTACATCDGAFFKGKEVLVIGGGDSAMEEALFLTKFASKVTIVHRREEFRASKIMQDRALAHEKIEVIYNAVVDEVLGDNKVTGAKLKNPATGATTEITCDGIFMAIGHNPNTDIFQGTVDLDHNKFVIANKFMHTNIKGVFAAGDVQDTRFRQAITAAGSGCMAALEAEKFLQE